MANNCDKPDEVIDLTDSFTLASHYALSDAVIELLDTDESFIKSPVTKKKPKRKSSKKVKTKVTTLKNERISETKKIGDCPICLDPLGKKPLAATKCGHVFCMQCLKQCLLIDCKCPTCRCKLKGLNSYHPLYF